VRPRRSASDRTEGRALAGSDASIGRPDALASSGQPAGTGRLAVSVRAAASIGLLLVLISPAQARVERCELRAGYEIPRPGEVSAANRRQLAGDVNRVARQHRLEPALVNAVIAAESGFNPVAVSEDGAVGLMQVLPATGADYGAADLCDPVANLETGTAHLARLLRQYRNISHALAAYNAGEGSMQKQRRRVTYLETRKFVVRAIAFYWRYKG
jgi:soluble lytic murein transglycosylase-like protein